MQHRDQHQKPYELDQPAFQKPGTWQCWWLSLLEAARANGKLDETFQATDGILHVYFATYNASNKRWTPDEGELPPSLSPAKSEGSTQPEESKEKDPSQLEDFMSPAKSRVPETPKLEVYGPQWQRMIMYFLWDETDTWHWCNNKTTCISSKRRDRLADMLNHLGVKGVILGQPFILLSSNVFTDNKANPLSKFSNIKDKQWVIVDKEVKDKKNRRLAHAMSGIVEHNHPEDPKSPTHTRIRVYNQAIVGSAATRIYQIEKNGKNSEYELLDVEDKSKLNWLLPLEFGKSPVGSKL